MATTDDESAKSLIRIVEWWYGKSDEQRRAFLEDETASKDAKERITLVERFAEQHCYFISSETGGKVNPLPPLSSTTGRLQRFSRREKNGSNGVLWLPRPTHAMIDFGGRYRTAEQREGRRAEAYQLLRVIYDRTAAALIDQRFGTQSKSNIPGGQYKNTARILTDVLVTASLAALLRTGVAGEMEATEAQNSRLDAAKSEQHDDKPPDAAPKSVGACRAEAWGCLGIWEILLSRQSGERTGTSPARTSGTPTSVGLKRWREEEEGEGSDASRSNRWRLIRGSFAPRDGGCPDISAGRRGEGMFPVPCRGASPITIIASDVRFGIAKALKDLQRSKE